jgi:hypothetical protein
MVDRIIVPFCRIQHEAGFPASAGEATLSRDGGMQGVNPGADWLRVLSLKFGMLFLRAI